MYGRYPPSSCLHIARPGVRVILVAGSAAAGRAARVVLFVFVVVIALRAVVVRLRG